MSSAAAGVIKAVPPGLVNKKAQSGHQAEEDTTDNGSCLSDNEVSCSSEASVQNEQAVQQALPIACSFLAPGISSRRKALQQAGQKALPPMPPILAPAVASRRNALQQAGQQVLVSISQPASAPTGGGAQKKAKAKQQVQAPIQELPAFLQPDPLKASRQQAPTQEVYLEPEPLQAPFREAFLEPEPLKVERMASSDPGSMAQWPLDPLLPAKKRPIFVDADAGAAVRAFHAYCPLKKRVPDFLLEEPPRVVCW